MTTPACQERKNSSLAFYRRVGTSGWGKSNYYTDIRKHPLLRKWISARLPVKRGSVISVGCGTGELERSLAEQSNRWVVGLDLSLEMLRTAARRGSTAFVQADGHALPFGMSSFDAAVLPESVGHLEMDIAFPEIARVLKARSWLVITTYSQHRSVHRSYRKYTGPQILAHATKAGFDVQDQRLLRLRPGSVQEVHSEADCGLIFLLARKQY